MCSRILGAVALAAVACAAIISSGCMSDAYDVAIVPVNDEMRARYAPGGSYDLGALRAAELAHEIPRDHAFGTLERGGLEAAAGAWTEHDFVNLGAGAVRVTVVNQAKVALHSDAERATSPLWLLAREAGELVDWDDFQWAYLTDWVALERSSAATTVGDTSPRELDASALAIEVRDCRAVWERTLPIPDGSFGTNYVLDRVGFEIPEGGSCRVRWRFFSHEAEASYRVVFSVDSGRAPFPSVTELRFTGGSSDPSCEGDSCPRATHELTQEHNGRYMHEFPVRTLDFGHVGTDHASHRLVWFKNFSDHALQLRDVRVLDLDTLAPFTAEAPGRYELVATTSDSVPRCAPGALLEPGAICFLQVWYSGEDAGAIAPLDHGILDLEYSEEGSETVERHALWLVAQTSPGEGVSDPVIDVPHLGSTRMNIARPMFRGRDVPEAGVALYSDGSLRADPYRLACRERVPAMECTRFEASIDGSRASLYVHGSMLWALDYESEVEIFGVNLDGGETREYEFSSTRFLEFVESSHCVDVNVWPNADTFSWTPDPEAADPMSGIFTLELGASGYECDGPYLSTSYRVEFRMRPAGTPEAVSVTEVP